MQQAVTASVLGINHEIPGVNTVADLYIAFRRKERDNFLSKMIKILLCISSFLGQVINVKYYMVEKSTCCCQLCILSSMLRPTTIEIEFYKKKVRWTFFPRPRICRYRYWVEVTGI